MVLTKKVQKVPQGGNMGPGMFVGQVVLFMEFPPNIAYTAADEVTISLGRTKASHGSHVSEGAAIREANQPQSFENVTRIAVSSCTMPYSGNRRGYKVTISMHP